MVRAERQVVLDMLFSAFEKHQYYNIKELVDITKQPVVSSMLTHISTNKPIHNNIAWNAKNNTPAHYPPCLVKFEQIAHHMMFTLFFVAEILANMPSHAHTHTHTMMNRYRAGDLFQLVENSNV